MKNLEYNGDPVNISKGKYHSNGRIALSLFSPTEGPYAQCTVNIPNIPLEEGEAIIDENNSPGMAAWLLKNKLAEDTGRTADYGFVENGPILKILI